MIENMKKFNKRIVLVFVAQLLTAAVTAQEVDTVGIWKEKELE